MKYDELFPDAEEFINHKDSNGNTVYKTYNSCHCDNCYDDTSWYFFGGTAYVCSEECNHSVKLIRIGNQHD